jgi:hypothetical protein
MFLCLCFSSQFNSNSPPCYALPWPLQSALFQCESTLLTAISALRLALPGRIGPSRLHSLSSPVCSTLNSTLSTQCLATLHPALSIRRLAIPCPCLSPHCPAWRFLVLSYRRISASLLISAMPLQLFALHCLVNAHLRSATASHFHTPPRPVISVLLASALCVSMSILFLNKGGDYHEQKSNYFLLAPQPAPHA